MSYATQPYFKSQQILNDSAKKYFDGCAAYNSSHLDQKFISDNIEVLKYQRGAGYWLWKPYLILKTLEQLQDGDLLFYVDSGNIIVDDPKPLFDIANEDKMGLILFENRDGEPNGEIWPNYMWTKADCFNLTKMNANEYIYGKQIDGSYFLIRKNKNIYDFLNEYFTYCKNPNIITDLPNISGPNLSPFRDHRHDQSILSLMAIKYNLPLHREPSQWGNHTITPTSKYKQIFDHHRRRFYGQ